MVLEGVGPVPLTVVPTENVNGVLLAMPVTEKSRSPTTKITSPAEGMVYVVAAAPVRSRNPEATTPVIGGIDELLVKMETLAPSPGLIVSLYGEGPSWFARGRGLGPRGTCPGRSG